MRIKWFPNAIRDINGLYEYYAEKSLHASSSIYNNILDDIDLLSVNPYIAAVEPLLEDKPKGYRSYIVSKGKIKIVYYVENDIIHIARIWACRQNPKKLKSSLT